MCHKWAEENTSVRFCAINPTFVIGPVIGPKMGTSMKYFQSICAPPEKDKPKTCKNDSMSFIDVRDTAAHHVAACANSEVSGRFMSVVESLHWNDIMPILCTLCKWETQPVLFEGDLAKVSKFDSTRMDSLGVECRSVSDCFKEAYEYL